MSTRAKDNMRLLARVAALPMLATGCRSVLVAPPSQPASGPGGADYLHAAVKIDDFGEGDDEYWIITPDKPVPDAAPVVVFLHGWGGMTPDYYASWLKHIARKGHIVVFPRYQADLTVRAPEMEEAARRAVVDAWARLRADGPIRPDDTGMAWVGHSLGGYLATNLAAQAVDLGLPEPVVLMTANPGNGLAWLDPQDRALQLEGVDRLPATLLALCVAGDEDDVVGAEGARAIATALAHLDAGNVELLTIRSDRHTSKALVADHFAPLAADGSFVQGVGFRAQAHARRLVRRRAPDALDYYGYWKLLDGLLDAAFRGIHREYALGGTQQQRFMGRYSDGAAVTPIERIPADAKAE